MKFFSRYNKTILLILFLTLVSALLHFYNYNWGAPYYFHPDERNIASAVTQLKWPEQMNPHFFAYGALPIYTIFFTGIVIHHLPGLQSNTLTSLSFSEAIIIGRFYSALLSTLLVPLLFLVGRKIKNDFVGIIACVLAVGSTGLIQFSHFGTFEIWLTFFTLLLFYTILLLIKETRLKYFTFASLLCGILLSIKITSIVLLPMPLFVSLLHLWKSRKIVNNIFSLLAYLFYLISITVTVFIISNPYVILDNTAFLASMEYESSVGFNTLPVFYTQGFYDTIPVLYQFLHIYPFLLNPIITVLFLAAFTAVVLKTIRQKKMNEFILLIFFIILFVSQAFLFIKWTRYMVPTLPFIYLLIGLAVTYLHTKKIKTILVTLLIISNSLFGLSYFITIFLHEDSRLTAANFAKHVIPQNVQVVSEMYDLGVTAFNPYVKNITLFNTYDLDTNSPDFNIETWNNTLSKSDFVILPSQRVLQTRLVNKKRYPSGYIAYESLLNGQSGFQKIYETPCDIFCKITYLGDPIYYFEQTVNVFDRPTVMIFKKTSLY